MAHTPLITYMDGDVTTALEADNLNASFADAAALSGNRLLVPEFTGNSVTDTTATQTVLNAAVAGDEVLLPDGDLTLNAGLVASKGIRITSKGNTRIFYSSLAGVHAIECWGTLGSDVNLSGNCAAGATTLSFTTSGYVAGDSLMLRSNALWSSFEAGALQGEVVVIKTVDSGSAVTLEAPTFDAYTTANTARIAKVNWVENFQLDGRIRFVNSTPEQGNGQAVYLRYCKAPKIQVRTDLHCGSGCYFETCIDGEFDVQAYYGNQNGAVAHGYGANLVGACQRCRLYATGAVGWVLTTTNGSPRGGVPRGCSVSGHATGPYNSAAFHTHYVGEYINYDNVSTTGCVGLFIAAKNITVRNPQVSRSPTDGIYIDVTGTGVVILNPYVKDTLGAVAQNNAAIKNLGVDTKIIGGLLEGLPNTGRDLIYCEGSGMVVKGTVLIPGATKTGMTTWDSTDTWVADDLTVINASVGTSYGLPSPLTVPTPRISNLKTYNVTTPSNPAGGNGGLISRTTGGSSAVVFPGGVSVKEGTNAKMGVATLIAGTLVVATTAVTATTRIFLTKNSGSSTGALRVSARTAATSFTITSSDGADTSTVAWMLVEPA